MEIYMPHEQEGDSNNAPDGQQKSPEEQLGIMVNAAVTAHMKRFESRFTQKFDESIKSISDKIAAAPPPASEGEGEGKKKSKQDPEALAMAKRIEDMERLLKTSEDQRIAAEKKAREERAYTELRSALEGKVRPELLDIVAKNLMVVEGRVEFDDAGVPLFKTQRTAYPGADPEDAHLPLKAGVDDFLKGDSAKAFLPAPSSSGASPLPKRSNPTPGGVDFNKPAQTDSERIARANERMRLAQQTLGQK